MSEQLTYPSATAEDGYSQRAGVSQTWADIIAANGTQASDGDTGFSMILQAHATTDRWQTLRRGLFMFDVSPLPPGAIVSGANVSFYPNSVTAEVFSSSFAIAAGDSASATGVVAGDYQLNAQPTEYSDSRVLLSNIVATTRFSFDLNAVGYAALQAAYDASEVFKTSLLFDWDLDAASPTWAGSSVKDDITIMCYEDGAPKLPTLTITFRVGRGYATIELTGTLAGGGADTVTADIWAVEVFT